MFVGTGDRELAVGIGVGVVGSPSVAEGGLRRMAEDGLREEEEEEEEEGDRIPASDMVVRAVGMASCLICPVATQEEEEKRSNRRGRDGKNGIAFNTLYIQHLLAKADGELGREGIQHQTAHHRWLSPSPSNQVNDVMR